MVLEVESSLALEPRWTTNSSNNKQPNCNGSITAVTKLYWNYKFSFKLNETKDNGINLGVVWDNRWALSIIRGPNPMYNRENKKLKWYMNMAINYHSNRQNNLSENCLCRQILLFNSLRNVILLFNLANHPIYMVLTCHGLLLNLSRYLKVTYIEILKISNKVIM